MNDFNIITTTDSYKNSHWLQYPKDAEEMFSYIESRGGKYSQTVMFGLRYIIQKYISKPITQQNINKAEKIAKLQGMPFNKEGWEYILEKHNGYLPIRIKAIPEGNVVETGNALLTIESTDPKVFWIVGHVEPILLRIWYPITVATLVREVKKIIKPFVDKTSDNPQSLDFMFTDFGARAATSHESASIAGMAHLLNFSVTDTIEGIEQIIETYDTEDFIAGSVPASEHSTMTSYGKENEKEAYENMIDTFCDKNSKYKSPIMACVLDAYDIFNAVDNIVGKELKEKIQNSDTLFVCRPDSGNALYMCLSIMEKLDSIFGHTINSKGYKVLNNVRVIQGDGIYDKEIFEILNYMEMNGYSSDNIVFGAGGYIHQNSLSRDTQKFALKCSAIKRAGKWQNVYKSPLTDRGKISKKGRLEVIKEDDKYITLTECNIEDVKNSVLKVFYENGKMFFDDSDSFQNVKRRATV